MNRKYTIFSKASLFVALEKHTKEYSYAYLFNLS